MYQLIVRGLDLEVYQALRIRAAQNGRSAEAEHREILKEVLLGKPKRSLKELLLAMPAAVEDSDFERSPDSGREVEL